MGDIGDNDIAGENFSDWLGDRLKELKIDETVFSPYITSILEGDEDQEEIVESLDGILGELGNGIVAESLRDEILSKWNQFLAISKKISTSTEGRGDQLNEILRKATESAESGASKNKTEPDPKLRAAILSAVAQANSSESEDEQTGPSSSNVRKKKTGDSDHLAEFGRNTNAEKVLAEQREQKDKARAESAKKKERDKEDRAKQKAAAEERKDKAKKKATKVERKR